MLQHLNEFKYSTGILIDALKASDADRAHEAISVMLMQFVAEFAENQFVATQLFPVLDRLQQKIDKSQLKAALDQATKFDRQLSEVIGMVSHAR